VAIAVVLLALVSTVPVAQADARAATSTASFNRVVFDTMQGPTVVQRGPDGRIYVGNVVGEIRRYDVDPTTGLPAGPPRVINKYVGKSEITGIAFSGHNLHPDVWVSRGAQCDQCAITKTGTISLLTGRDLAKARDVIVGLPRSYHDHMNNGIHFGPDGRLYIAQGGMTGYGAPDTYWGDRSETPLSASILVADVLHDARFQGTVDVDTNHGYNATAADAPVRVYAEGLRNTFDFVFAGNGHLYAPGNESSNGNAPAGPGGNPPELDGLPSGPDMFDDIVPGGYYGHPNPAQGHYTLMGGNPTGVKGPWIWTQYPVGTQPDPAWIKPMLNLHQHRSPDGVTEYRSDAFAGALKGQLLLTEFANGDDLLALQLGEGGTRIASVTQLATGFDNPIGVASDLAGHIYVNEFGDETDGTGGQITLLQPTTPGGSASPQAVLSTPDDFLGVGPRLVFSTAANDQTRPARPVFIQNPSTATLTVSKLAFSGTNAGDFAITSAPPRPFTVPPNGQQEIDLAFRPVSTAVEQYASFDVTTDDPVQPVVSAALAGADAVGFEGGREPKLRDITRVLGFTDAIPIRPGTTRLPASNDEVISPYWLAADSSQPVVLHPLAHYSARQTAPSLLTAWDTKAAPKTLTQLYSFAGGSDPYGGANQQIEPPFTGTDTFSPGTTPFGLEADNAYSDDFYNGAQRLHNVRFFIAKGPGGVVLPHTWIVAIDIGNKVPPKNFDYQDEVILMTNADPLLAGAAKPNDKTLGLSFTKSYPGTVLDAGGHGTGFGFVLPNTAGNQYDASKLVLDTAHGTLSLTSTVGTMTAHANNQIDALASHFDATRGTFTITGHLAGPFTQIDSGHDHQALWWGADQDDFTKLEVENDAGQPSIIVFHEQVTGAGGIANSIIAGPLTPAGLASASDLALTIHCDPASDSCTFAYAIDAGSASDVGVTATPTFPLLWFSRSAAAGILVSNQSSTTPFVGRYSSFAVTAP
jgi:glucose/arabinose dehydrogenase